MNRVRRLAVGTLLLEAILAWMADRHRSPEPVPQPYLVPFVWQFTATPGTVTFTSSDPDVGASASATVNVSILSASWGKAWNVTVQAGGPTLTNCAQVPVSAVSAVCDSVTLSGSGSSPTGSCSAPVALSTTPATIASGAQGNWDDTYTIHMTYQFTDAWQYPGASAPACSATLTYTLNLTT